MEYINKLKIENSWLKTTVFILLIVFYASLSTYKIALPVYDDLPRQIKIGEEVLHGNINILYKNTFSYVEPDQTFYNHHWLSGVIFYILYSLVGWGGLVIFKVLVLLSFFSVLFFTALKRSNFWIVSVISIPVILILSERAGLRPEIFSYLLISVYIYILSVLYDTPESNKIFWLIPLQLLWVNLHIFFSIGIMLVGGILIEKIIHSFNDLRSGISNVLKNNKLIRNLIVVFAGVVFVSFINPRGLEGVFYRYPGEYPVVISEFQTLSQYESGLSSYGTIQVNTFKILSIIIIISFLIYFWVLYKRNKIKDTRNIEFFLLISSVATIFIGYRILRGITLFATIFLVSFPVIVDITLPKDKYSWNFDKNLSIVAKTFFALFLLFLILNPNIKRSLLSYVDFGVGLTEESNGSIEFYKKNNLKGPIFNDADIGSYLLFHLYPSERVFADNRFGDAYSVGYGKNTYLASINNEEEWLRVSKKYDFKTIYLYQYGGNGEIRNFIWRRFMDPAWILVYVDRYAVIFVRNLPENKDLISRYGITRDNSLEKMKSMINSGKFIDMVTAADLLNLVGQNDFAQNLFLEIIYKWPNKGHIWMIMGEWEVAIDQYRSRLLAIMYLERAISLGQDTAETYTYLGMAYNKIGQTEKAIDMLEKAVNKNPKRRDAKDLLYQLTGSTSLD